MSDCRTPLAWRVGFLLAGLWAVARGADLADVRHDLLVGNYDKAIEQAGVAVNEAGSDAEWSALLVAAELATGKNSDAATAMAAALGREPSNIRLRWLARDVAYANGKPEEALERVNEIGRLILSRRYDFRAPSDVVIIGRAALLLGNDPKEVLEKLYGSAQKSDPKLRDVYLARGDLALEKHDFALAATAYDEGLKQLPDDPDLHFGRALAYAGSDREAAMESLAAAVKLNPRHGPSLLQLADFAIDAEDYAAAAKRLDEVIAVNPTQPEAWAYRAVLAHLRNDVIAETEARAQALRNWPGNPHVDYLIGKKLSEKYRFAEGASYQRRARAFDPSFLPASAQLASDLLRLGNEDEGWGLAQAVHEKDDYDVEAFNLVTLHDTMAKYATLTNDDFVVRISAREAEIYGPRVLELLTRAKGVLTTKYGVELAKPTYVEIFADQKDFAVRTFGLPDVPGFLGVCFGRVVTANGPAATSGHPTNWQSVLWHEFCHAVTLQLTRNKMPRWLSEGISVYEERQANRAWGMRIDPKYREMIARDELTPIATLSAAFLAPKSPQHLQFAYLEASLVVEFVATHYGIDHLRDVLRELSTGTEINAALAKHIAPLAKLEKEFSAFAHEQADQLAPKLNWEKPAGDLLLPDATKELADWALAHPDNYWAMLYRARALIGEEKWADAKAVLSRLVELYPTQKGGDTAYRPLVKVLHALNDTEAERATLATWAALDDEATDAYVRLMELGAAANDWPAVARNADRYLGVNPLVAPPWRYLAQASAATGDVAGGIAAWRTLIQLDPPDPAEAHFQLAKLLKQHGDTAEARRHVLLALEEAPRYREALKLLLELNRASDATGVSGASRPVTVVTPP